MALSVRADAPVLMLALAPDGDEGKNRAAGQPFVAAGANRGAGRNNVRASEADMGGSAGE